MSAATTTSKPAVAAPGAGQFLSTVAAWVLTVGGGIGLLAAAVLTVEKINLLTRPGYVPTCSINPILSCGSVMTTPQAEAFGFPNPLIGIAGFAAVTTIGVILLARVRLPRWFWLGLQGGVTFGVVFVHWLIYQSVYVIGALCPYCMAVWAVTIPIFLYTTLSTLRANAHALPATVRAVTDGAARYHSVILVAWYAVIVAAILHRFWDYWSTLA
ncbi:vitamin K epoxide reductase family protein [Micromonospora endolithica]|uniref:Vitamin K epoxide reductase family protein n=1 Tax=Micromonospora endolithica TaxID=230091 RepID=A0A3A9ZQ56_9ACTN|nr:vitamin K epoxide reductase family protein [Micromonospora endolithica]RKN50362.1 vitamin K epoxide reductase family protein [Micromonospora endolithica]TWJ20968.1 putative membrane protein [Micromonospora endolithica]